MHLYKLPNVAKKWHLSGYPGTLVKKGTHMAKKGALWDLAYPHQLPATLVGSVGKKSAFFKKNKKHKKSRFKTLF